MQKNAAQEQEKETLKKTLAEWLSKHIPNAKNMNIDDIYIAGAGGFSAETWFITASWQVADESFQQEMVLRRQIIGHDLLHQPELDYQARIMQALANHTLPAPAPTLIGIEKDSALLGTPFLIMPRLSGSIAPQNPNYNVAGWLTELKPEQRRETWFNGIRAMAEVHKIKWQNDFEFMSRDKTPDLAGYIDWLEDWINWAVDGRDYKIGRDAISYLKNNQPPNAKTVLLWGDSQPSNILFDEKTGQVTGLLDWELGTLGPAEIDLSWWLMFDELFSDWMHVPRLEGLPDREACIACFEAAAGRRVEQLEYYDVISRLRMAIVTMRSVDRQVAKGNYKKDNVAWSDNAFTTALAQSLNLPAIETSTDYIEFTTALMKKD
jgi:aminoglycoside phosphotransferase (APT) family kinase protein